MQLSTKGQGLHSVFLPREPGTSMAFTITMSECPRHAPDCGGSDGGARGSNPMSRSHFFPLGLMARVIRSHRRDS